MSIATEVKVAARARAFAGDVVREHKFVVDLSDDSVRVWDSVAGHYTLCHSLSYAATKRIVKIAKSSR